MSFQVINKTNDLLIYDVANDNVNYYAKSGLSVAVLEGMVRIINTDSEGNTTLAMNTRYTDVTAPSSTSAYDLATQIYGYIATASPDGFSGGWADYEDVATTGTPINVTATPAVLTNDGTGVNTNTSYLPIGGNGITQLWNTSSNGFDFSELEIGDMVDIRMHISVIIASTNTVVDVNLHMGSGGSVVVPFISDQNYKATGTFEVIRYMGVYVGSTDVRDTLAQLKIEADKNCTCIVHGWYIKAIRRG